MITAQITGGLGNQLFTYARLATYARNLEIELRIDGSIAERVLGRRPDLFDFNLLGEPRISAAAYGPISVQLERLLWRNRYLRTLSKRHAESHLGGSDFTQKLGWLESEEGFFQDFRVAEGFIETFGENPLMLKFESKALKRMSDDVKRTKAVAVHVRKGDYLNYKNSFGLLNDAYYLNALKQLSVEQEISKVLIFTDSPGLVTDLRAQIEFSSIIIGPSDLSTSESLVLMSRCAGLITSNSTFSFWAAILGNNSNVVIPNPWFKSQDTVAAICRFYESMLVKARSYMDLRMRVAIGTNALSGGGAENSMRMINQKLVNAGQYSTLISLNKTENILAGKGELQIGREWKSGLIQTFMGFINFCRIIRKLNPDIIVVNCELPELYVAFLPMKIKRLICVEHTSKPWAGRKLFGRLIRNILLIRKSIWVTVNKSQDSLWPRGSISAYIPNPVEIPVLRPAEVGQPEFVFVGRLRTEKGIETILQSVSEINKRIDVFGSGILEDRLKAKYSEIAVFHGYIDEPWKLISQKQVLVVASEYEGDGKVIVEGIIAGLPLLLLDNEDLRRFELPDSNYFSNGVELKMKLTHSLLHPEEYKPNVKKIHIFMEERAVDSIVVSWRKLFSQ